MTIPKVYLFPKLSWDTKKRIHDWVDQFHTRLFMSLWDRGQRCKKVPEKKGKKRPGVQKKWRPGPTKGKASILVGWFYENPRDPWWIRCEIHPGGLFWFGSSRWSCGTRRKATGIFSTQRVRLATGFRGQKSSSIITWFNRYHTTSHRSFPLLYWITRRKPVVNNLSKIICPRYVPKKQNITTHHRNIYCIYIYYNMFIL